MDILKKCVESLVGLFEEQLAQQLNESKRYMTECTKGSIELSFQS